MVYLYEGGGLLGFSTFVSSLATFLLAIAYANLVPKAVYGSYRYILGAIGILAIPTLHGLNVALIQTVSAGFGGSLNLVRGVKLRWGLYSLAGGFIVALYYFLIGNTSMAISFLLVAAGLPVIEANVSTDAYVIGKELYKVSSAYRIGLEGIKAV
jgi:hypothetical protein